jgi:hypothetical protein
VILGKTIFRDGWDEWDNSQENGKSLTVRLGIQIGEEASQEKTDVG